MNAINTEERLSGIFQTFFEIEASEFSPALNADDVDSWDSLNHIRLMLEVQKDFGVKFSARDISELTNTGDLIVLIEQKMTG